LAALIKERYDYANPGDRLHFDVSFLEEFHKGVVHGCFFFDNLELEY